jgi:hypothetical protein
LDGVDSYAHDDKDGEDAPEDSDDGLGLVISPTAAEQGLSHPDRTEKKIYRWYSLVQKGK